MRIISEHTEDRLQIDDHPRANSQAASRPRVAIAAVR